MMQGKFNGDARIEYSEVKSKPRDMTRLQAAMFMDRMDLWQSKARRHPKPLAREQQKLF